MTVFPGTLVTWHITEQPITEQFNPQGTRAVYFLITQKGQLKATKCTLHVLVALRCFESG